MGNIELFSTVLSEIRKKFPKAKNVTAYIEFCTNSILIETDTGEKVSTKSLLISTIVKPKIVNYLKSIKVIPVVMDYIKIDITINPESTKIFVYHSDPKLKVSYYNEIIIK